ncbi:YidC/Oxa1 family membrane protein insertase, partial [Staphylococcus haemolyticus]|uniref:YidC/Oxa1 family membrane protein insertase n=1 Tax=Staphylococcus haemolyticus TaxID=1283 RepID=UPI00164300F6
KIKLAKPQVDGLQEKLKPPPTQEDKIPPNQQIIQLYKKCHINPINTPLPSLPLLIQIPLLIGLYFLLRCPIRGGIAEHPHFLCF